MIAILQSSGNKDNEIERLTRSVMGEAKTGAPSFRNLPVRLSIPALFAGFSCSKSLRMVAGATGAKEKFFPLKFSFFAVIIDCCFPYLFGGVESFFTRLFAKFE